MFISGTVGSFVGERSNRGERERKKLRAMDDRLCKRRNVNAPGLGALARVDHIVLLTFISCTCSSIHHLSQPQRALGHDRPSPRVYLHGVAYACWRPRSKSPGSCRFYVRRAAVATCTCTLLCLSLTSEGGFTEVTIMLYGCTGDAILTIARPWTLRSCLTAKE